MTTGITIAPGEFSTVCSLADLPRPGVLQVRLADRLLAVVQTDQGELYAIDDTCTHAAVSLSEGLLRGRHLECWLHGSGFDVRTGEPTSVPATEPVATYRIQVVDGAVQVALT